MCASVVTTVIRALNKKKLFNYLQNKQKFESRAAHARRFQHVQQLVLTLILLDVFAVVLLTVTTKRPKIIIRHLAAINFGHALKSPDGSIDVITCDQPLGALLDEEVEKCNQEEGNRGTGQKNAPVANPNGQPRGSDQAKAVETSQNCIKSHVS